MENTSKQRWYDIEPTMSLAISMMQAAPKDVQLECAKMITQKARDFNISIEANKLTEAFNYFCKRWYDHDKDIADSFQYLQIMPFELQKEVSLDIIEKLNG